jgi:HlyD family secretion protein
VLVVLERIRAESEAGARTSRYRTLVAIEARLRAERANMESVTFDHPVLADRKNQEVRDAIQAQRNHFETRRESMISRQAILRQRIAQLATQVQGLERQLTGTKQQSALIAEEIASVRKLYDKGLERKPRLLALRREQAKLLGTEGELVARVARTSQAIGETKLQIANLKIERIEEIASKLTDVIAKRTELEKEMRASMDRLRRTHIRAPVAGTVLGLRYKTTGGVIGPGEPILDLVPAEGDLVIEARIRPNDIDELRSGQSAYVVFPSFVQRHLKRIEGVVQRYSPDAFEDKRTGERYYSARITVDRKRLNAVSPQIHLSPGMPAEVFIATHERTMIEFLLQPFLMTLERAFRES